jgi:hypothetical protein
MIDTATFKFGQASMSASERGFGLPGVSDRVGVYSQDPANAHGSVRSWSSPTYARARGCHW